MSEDHCSHRQTGTTANGCFQFSGHDAGSGDHPAIFLVSVLMVFFQLTSHIFFILSCGYSQLFPSRLSCALCVSRT